MNPQNDPPSAPSKPTKHQKHGKNPFYAGPPGQTTNKSDSAQPTLSIPPTTTAPTASNRATKRARDELEPKPSTDDDESEPDTEHSVSELNGLSKPDLVALVLRLQRHTRRLEGEIRTALAKVPLGEDELRQKVEELRTEIRTGIAEQMNVRVVATV
ncbi:uncharacterized protein BDZ99DRAFT_457651 [Mytilinidion resinicola]|uniref:Uncharacterized protein n=1 Tax=Mytilinidion resinicola TaxID=574789 RepID=A0A6A6Z3S2_9PEZI|nr:uncharacterized protein BDZ99DRAFT_457651 [Mytilinidion resinicola]KAF2815670.1 hypothetical protein BDZ99DRAFT_457651 [Mytilinidion resinicola]